MKDTAKEFEEPPGRWRRLHPRGDAPPAQRDDPRWEVNNRRSTWKVPVRVIRLNIEEMAGLWEPGPCLVHITPCFANLLSHDDPGRPIRQLLVAMLRVRAAPGATHGDELVPCEAEDYAR